MSVSVVIPSYNSGRFVPSAISSVLAQTRPVAQSVVVDDGSTDDTAAIAAGFSTQIDYIVQENGGVSLARNRGLAEARGTYCLFLDADDRLTPQAIERLHE